MLKHVKAIGWYVEEYGIVQVSMNLTNIEETPLHAAFDACREAASKRGLRVTGSEVVGMLPKKCLVEAGKYFLRKHAAELGVADPSIHADAVEFLRAQTWPGNVRELENVVRKVLLLGQGYTINEEHVRAALSR